MLAIRDARFDCHLVGVATAERSQHILDRLLSGLRHELPAAFDRIDLDGEGLVHIEHLAMTARIDLAWSDSAIARSIAGSLLESIDAALESPGTVRFLDEAERLARFLIDLADGAAFTKAWHEVFAGLRLLPTSAVVRSLAQLDAATTLVALGRLSVAQRRRVVALMTTADARHTLAELARAPGEPARDPAIIARVLATLGRAPFAGTESSAAALIFAGALHADCGASADQVTFDIAAELLADGLQESGKLLDETLTALKPATDAATYDSPHGGVWLLLPELIALGVDASHAFIVLAICAGPNARQVWQEVALRNALGVPPDDRPPDLSWADVPRPIVTASRRDIAHVRQGSEELGLPGRARAKAHRLAVAAIRSYARRLPGFGDSSLPHLWCNLLAAPASVTIEESRLSVMLMPPALQVVWRLSGADRADYRLPDGRCVSVRGSR